MIVLDTHILLWLHIEKQKVPNEVFTEVERKIDLGISAISLWEISMLYQKKRIELPCKPLEWFNLTFSNPKFKLLPITPEIAAISGTLEMHGDPADRIIAASSIFHKCPLATVDGKLCELDFLDIV